MGALQSRLCYLFLPADKLPARSAFGGVKLAFDAPLEVECIAHLAAARASQVRAMAGDAILILTTGGTIDKVYFDALSAYQIGEAAVVRILETGRVTRPLVVEEVMRKDSLELTDADRTSIVEHIERSPASRVVVTHGTDTMTDTARAPRGCRQDYRPGRGAFPGALRGKRRDVQSRHGVRHGAGCPARGLYHHERLGLPRREVVKDRAAGAFTAAR